MKTKITLILAALFVSFNVSFAQQDEECMTNLTIFTDYAKSKRYDEAYEPWIKVRNKCPKFNYAIYAYGEKILKHKIENSTGAEQVAYIKDLIKVWDEGFEYYASKYKLGGVLSDKALLMYDYQKELGAIDKQIYDAFDKAYKEDLENFTSSKGLYVYFTKIVDLNKAGQAPIQDVFNKYDDVSEQLENITKNFTEKLIVLVEKEEAGQTLTSKEERYKNYYQASIDAYEKISGSIDTYLGQLANCENLIPLYAKDFEIHKNDAVWLKRAVSRMYNKECTDDPLYIKLVKAYDETAPSGDTKYFVASLLFKQDKDNEAMDYLNQSYELETDGFKKGKLANRIASILKSKGRYGQARGFYREALKLNPTNGRPYLSISSMYASSANSCGDTNFNKRAVFWLAADEARKAGKVDATLRSVASQTAENYESKAPQRAEIFSASNEGERISIGCWIGLSVTVPNL
jgi:tetratricopeptide (TPR) repeat protein